MAEVLSSSEIIFPLLVVWNGAIRQFSSIETLSTSSVSVFFKIPTGFHPVWETVYKSVYSHCANASSLWSVIQIPQGIRVTSLHFFLPS